MTKVRAFITGWRKHPFIWTKPADQILATIDRKRKHISTSGHQEPRSALDTPTRSDPHSPESCRDHDKYRASTEDRG